MLKHLHIRNYALINELDADFAPGLTTVTGETGAGKSIMLGALSLLQGGRADRGKASAEGKTVVEGTFAISGFPHIAALLDSLDIEPCQDGEMLLRRELSAAGRSRAFINDTPVSLQTMAQVAAYVIDIHSQHANRLIADADYRLELIDAYADNATLRDDYTNAYDDYRRLRSHIARLKENIAHARENEEFIAFRLEHLRKLKPRAGEQAELENRLHLLSDASSYTEAFSDALQLLSEPETGAVAAIAQAAGALRKIDLSLFAKDSDLPQRLESARIELADIAATLEQYASTIEADPKELEYTEARLNDLYDAQRRFGVNSEDELTAMLARLEKEFAEIHGDVTDIKELEKQLHEKAKVLKEKADALSASRMAAAKQIAAELLEMARPLGLPNMSFSLLLTTGKLTASGADTPCFLVAFNKNQELREVQDVASGGEISRLMLCLKALMARRIMLPTIIFDEVDTGVSGDIAARMGALMSRMARNMQVITITHLPQVAAKGDQQFKVYKEDSDSATHTHIRRLTAEERQREIAAMLSGDTLSEAALLNASALLKS